MLLDCTSYNLTVSSHEDTSKNWELFGPNFTEEMQSSGASFNLNSLVASGILSASVVTEREETFLFKLVTYYIKL